MNELHAGDLQFGIIEACGTSGFDDFGRSQVVSGYDRGPLVAGTEHRFLIDRSHGTATIVAPGAVLLPTTTNQVSIVAAPRGGDFVEIKLPTAKALDELRLSPAARAGYLYLCCNSDSSEALRKFDLVRRTEWRTGSRTLYPLPGIGPAFAAHDWRRPSAVEQALNSIPQSFQDRFLRIPLDGLTDGTFQVRVGARYAADVARVLSPVLKLNCLPIWNLVRCAADVSTSVVAGGAISFELPEVSATDGVTLVTSCHEANRLLDFEDGRFLGSDPALTFRIKPGARCRQIELNSPGPESRFLIDYLVLSPWDLNRSSDDFFLSHSILGTARMLSATRSIDCESVNWLASIVTRSRLDPQTRSRSRVLEEMRDVAPYPVREQLRDAALTLNGCRFRTTFYPSSISDVPFAGGPYAGLQLEIAIPCRRRLDDLAGFHAWLQNHLERQLDDGTRVVVRSFVVEASALITN